MKKTYVTTMPDHIGAFLKASRCFADLGVNITRVSYNKAVDAHTLFIDAVGTPEQLEEADARLAGIGYLQPEQAGSTIVLLEFTLRDEPGGVTGVLELISDYDFNISYISSQENGSDVQQFKMGLFVEDPGKIERFVEDARKLCPVQVIEYNHARQNYDNSIFYKSFVSDLARKLQLTPYRQETLLINTNLAMQTLDEQGLSPYRTFDSIDRFAELLAAARGEGFEPRVTTCALTEQTELILIEPPCGSNTAILKSGEETLFIDCGYACYRSEMEALLRQLLPEWDTMEKTVLITHADVDHCGLLHLFDRVIASQRSAECLLAEGFGQDGFRESNPLHKPYINICKALTGYLPVEPEKLQVLHAGRPRTEEPLQQTGYFDFADLHFEVYEGRGGHLPGEILLIDYTHHVAFTGDVYVNIRGFTPRQAEYNRYAPILMTSVDTDPALCTRERQQLLQRLGAGTWRIFGGHGCMREYALSVEK